MINDCGQATIRERIDKPEFFEALNGTLTRRLACCDGISSLPTVVAEHNFEIESPRPFFSTLRTRPLSCPVRCNAVATLAAAQASLFVGHNWNAGRDLETRFWIAKVRLIPPHELTCLYGAILLSTIFSS